MSIREFKFKIGSSGTVEEVTTKVEEGTGEVSAAEKVLYVIIGVPVLIALFIHWLLT